ncbi:mechanosensitive ion channel [Roseomonas sp. SSH11]|uniref:Mechanosensitive ion channel n=1 Tax=Pararoseomonas baculiformis TaxID=2820812 RepID=A0ABS4AJU0_9PROT|nr:mechanosensitive ion channel domain-containing protein [Pararoseomonas baculiformis]MBP0447288.1 mechanosensitive ion channel [Pararoseomonas baculiformis]
MFDRIGDFSREIINTQAWLPSWAISLLTLAAAVALALAVHGILFRGVSRMVRNKDLFWRSLVARTSGPVRLGVVTFALSIASEIAPLTATQRDVLQHALLVGFVGLLGWGALTALHIWTTIYLRRFKLGAQDNLLARKHVTQARILRRVAGTLIIIVTVGAAMMTFSGVRQYGVSLLASAGAAGLVVGLALQPLLKNIFAGIQLAVTQPIRLDDAVIVEGEWGNVEEITSTYVVVRLWDWRRMVLPLTYFLEKPFQNWTRDSSALIGAVMIYLDYAVPVEEMRARLAEIAKSSPNWDGKVVNLQVTDFREHVMEVRMLVSASNAGRAFDLRCEVRERMIAWLQAEHPRSLPRRRTEIERMPRDTSRVQERRGQHQAAA